MRMRKMFLFEHIYRYDVVKNRRFQTHIDSLRSLTGPPIFNQTGFIQTTPVGAKFYS